MIVDVQSEIVIDRPVPVVADYAADPSNAPEWYANIDSVEWETAPAADDRQRSRSWPGSSAAGSRTPTRSPTASRRAARDGHQQGPFPMETTYTWTASGPGATRMTLRNRGEPAGFSKLTAPSMAAAMRRANRKDLANLKRILEAR